MSGDVNRIHLELAELVKERDHLQRDRDLLKRQRDEAQAEAKDVDLHRFAIGEIRSVLRNMQCMSFSQDEGVFKRVERLANAYDTMARQNASEAARDMRAQGALTRENDKLVALNKRNNEVAEATIKELVQERDAALQDRAHTASDRDFARKERDKMQKDLDSLRTQDVYLHQLFTNASVMKSDGRGHEYGLAERIGMLVQQRDLAFDGKQNAQRDAFQYADALKIELDAAKRELDALKNRPPQVNDAGIILCDLVQAKGLHERGDEEAYKKAKDGLWERAFALLGVPMPMHLNCPRCTEQHVDRDERRWVGVAQSSPLLSGEDWTKRLHKTHLCHYCSHEWRPEERCHTVGVARQVKTPDSVPVGRDHAIDGLIEQRDIWIARIEEICKHLGLSHIVIPPFGPLPRELITALENIDLNLKIAANASLTGMTHSLVPKDELADLLKARRILDHIRTLGI